MSKKTYTFHLPNSITSFEGTNFTPTNPFRTYYASNFDINPDYLTNLQDHSNCDSSCKLAKTTRHYPLYPYERTTPYSINYDIMWEENSFIPTNDRQTEIPTSKRVYNKRTQK